MATTAIPKRADKNTNLVLLSDIRSQKNSFLPIFRLPPETLENVFIHAARNCHEGDNFCVPHWVNVSYVCSHWRNVALNCPTLWTNHFTVSPRWTKELLARSKQASLKIRIYYSDDRAKRWWSHLMKELLNHAGRIQELDLTIPVDVLPAEFSLNAPRLQILMFHFLHCPSRRMPMINNGDTLPLRTLQLYRCPLPWYSSFNLSGVTTLFLCDVPSSSQQNILEFLTTLSGMQVLTVLHLWDALPSSRELLSSGAFAISLKVTLPRLTRLFVRAPLSTTIALLSRLGIPFKTQVRLEINPEDTSSVDDFAKLPSLLAQRFSQSEDPSSGPTIRSLILCFPLETEFTLCASERRDCDPNLNMWYQLEESDVPLMILVTMKQSMTNFRDNLGHFAGDICCSIPSTHVQTLHVLEPPSSHDFWEKTLGHLDGLRYMKLSNGYMPHLGCFLAKGSAAALGEDTHSDYISTPGDTFIPRLEELELDRITFSCPSSEDWCDDFSSEQLFLDGLSTRKALHLTMTDCKVESDDDDDDDGNDEDEDDDEDEDED